MPYSYARVTFEWQDPIRVGSREIVNCSSQEMGWETGKRSEQCALRQWQVCGDWQKCSTKFNSLSSAPRPLSVRVLVNSFFPLSLANKMNQNITILLVIHIHLLNAPYFNRKKNLLLLLSNLFPPPQHTHRHTASPPHTKTRVGLCVQLPVS